MSKVNGFEKYLISEGLNKVQAEMIAEINAMEQEGKSPIMTQGYVEMVISDLKTKLKLEN